MSFSDVLVPRRGMTLISKLQENLFTKSGQEPVCGRKIAMFSARTIYILGLLQIGIAVAIVMEESELFNQRVGETEC
jgi:hypothetical protein